MKRKFQTNLIGMSVSKAYQLSSSVNEETYVFGAIQNELSLASKKN